MSGKFRVSGALFAKDAPNGPIFAGTIEIDGVKTAISLWEKTSKAGNQYLQISEDKRGQDKIDAGGGGGQFGGGNKFKRPAPLPAHPNSPRSPVIPNNDMDDDIPF